MSELNKKKTISVQATEGNSLPLVHDGKKIKITTEKAEELTVEKLSYESKVIVCDAFTLKQIEVAKGAK